MTDAPTGDKPRKLTATDLPELNMTEGGGYCRFFKETWSGWEQTGCSGRYSTENECASATPSGQAYSWSGNSC